MIGSSDSRRCALRSGVWLTSCSTLALGLFAISLSSQSSLASNATNCGTVGCELTLDTVATLIDSHPRMLPDYSFYVSRDTQQRLVTVSRARDQVLVFDRDGRLLRSIGGPGDTAVQFTRVSSIMHDSEGSLFVYDLVSRRVTILDATLMVTATLSLPNAPSIVLPRTGDILVAAQLPTPDLIGFPLHVFSRDGQVVRSFGADRQNSGQIFDC